MFWYLLTPLPSSLTVEQGFSFVPLQNKNEKANVKSEKDECPVAIVEKQYNNINTAMSLTVNRSYLLLNLWHLSVQIH